MVTKPFAAGREGPAGALFRNQALFRAIHGHPDQLQARRGPSRLLTPRGASGVELAQTTSIGGYSLAGGGPSARDLSISQKLVSQFSDWLWGACLRAVCGVSACWADFTSKRGRAGTFAASFAFAQLPHCSATTPAGHHLSSPLLPAWLVGGVGSWAALQLLTATRKRGLSTDPAQLQPAAAQLGVGLTSDRGPMSTRSRAYDEALASPATAEPSAMQALTLYSRSSFGV